MFSSLGDVLAEDIVESLLDPLLKGIYAGSVSSLSARSVLKKIFQLEQRHGSIVGGLIKTRHDKQKEDPVHFLFNDLNLKDYESLLNKYAIYYFKDGMEILAKTLVDHLRALPNVELITDQTIQTVRFGENGAEISTRTNENYQLDHIISALPAFELAKLIDHDLLRGRLNRIPFVNMIVINLLYQREDIFPKEAFGYLIPSREHSHLLGVLFDSCIRHPTDKDKRGSQLTVMMGGAWFDELRLGQCTDEQLMHLVRSELNKQMKFDEQPIAYSINRSNQAIPVSEAR